MPKIQTIRCAAALVLAFSATAAPLQADDAGVSPYALVQAAAVAWTGHPSPRYLEYDVDFQGTGSHGRSPFERRSHVALDAETRRYVITPISGSGSLPLGVDADRQRIFPDDTFGFVARERYAVDRASPDASPEAMPSTTIAITHVVAPYAYDVADAGIETIDGHATHHLVLTPRSDPEGHRLRALWVDAVTADVRRMIVHAVVHTGPVSVPFLITLTYGDAGPYWLMQRAQASAQAHVLFLTFSAEGSATYANFTASTTPPEALGER